MKPIFLIVCINIGVIFNVSAEEQAGKLNATEINSIRTVSQALLKVRGQDRQRIEQEIKPLRDDLDEMKKVLTESVIELDTATNLAISNTNVAPTVAINNQKGGSWSGFWGRLASLWQEKGTWFETTKIQPVAEKKDLKYSNSIKKARHIVSERRSHIEGQLPSFWQVWKTPDTHRERSRDALIDLDSKLQAIENENPEVKRAKIKQLIGQLEKEAAAEQRPQEPTITSITKHLSE